MKNTATATEYTAVTNDAGSFTVPAIDPGAYTVTVTLVGFKTAVLNNVRVNAAVPATVRVTLELGGVEETVLVSAGSEIIQTQSAAVSATIDTNEILKLPTGSRNALDFITSLPGVNTPAGNRDSTVNGLPQSAINITIDGVSAQDNWLKTTDGFFARVSPRLDAMEEVTVSSAAQDAANTGQGAVQIRFATRSGSNDFRGSAYYYLQHYKLNANTWFNNRDLPPDPATGKAPKNEDKLYQPGMRLGGPIVIPGLWDGRNKAFFFFNYEESRSPGQNTENRTVLHPRAEQGLSAGPPAARPARSTCCSSPPPTATSRPSIRCWASCSATSAAPSPAPAPASSTLPTHCCSSSPISTRRRGSRSIRPAGSMSTCQQAPPVGVDELHRSAVDAGYHEQPRAELPWLPRYWKPAL